jgi:hypothetical protein
VELINPPQSYPLSLGPEGLYLSTLGFGVNIPPDVGGGVWWEHDSVSVDFDEDFLVEASLRIVEAPDHSVNLDTSWPRPGYTIAVSDVNLRFFWIGFGSGHVFLSNTAFGQYGSSNTVDVSFDTTDQHHVYRLQRASGGVGAALLIDGVPTLELAELGPLDGSAGVPIYFGDGTFWANSASHMAWVRVLENATAVALDPGKRELLHARPLASPARDLAVAFHAGAAGSLLLETFDLAGRRVAGSVRPVAAGESGTLSSAVGGAGVYFYRARLSPSSGAAPVSATGRVVVVR